MALRVRLLRQAQALAGSSRSYAAMSMALVTFLATGVAFLQSDAAIAADNAERAAELQSVGAISIDVGQTVQTGTDLAVFRAWYEQLERGSWATERAADPSLSSNEASIFGARAGIEYAIAEWSRQHSILLGEPYFNEETYVSDFLAYYAERQIEPSSRSAQQVEANLDVAAALDAKAANYVTVLTVLAAALFFLGLSATVAGRTRGIFLIFGTGFAVVSLLWTGGLALSTVTRVPEAAIEAVVRSHSASARLTNIYSSTISETDSGHYTAAIAAADEALAVAPDYDDAQLAAAHTRAIYVSALYFAADSDPAQLSRLIDEARNSYQSYLAENPDSYIGWWNKGWIELLSGNAAASQADTDRALALTPDYFVLYLNRSLAQVLAGNDEAAMNDVRMALDVAARTRLDSNATFFAAADFNINRLIELWPEDAEILTTLSRTIREGQVAIDALGQPAPASDAPALDHFMMSLSLGANGEAELVDPVENEDSHVNTDIIGYRLLLGDEQLAEDNRISLRLWLNGQLQRGHSVDLAWDPIGTEMVADLISPYGRAGNAVDPGEYHLELYVDGVTRGQIDWTVSAGS